MAVTLQFNENMYGTYRLEGGGTELRFSFHIDARARDLRQTARDGRFEASGFVEAEGLAAHSPIDGFMIVQPVIRRIIRYEFDFTDDAGRPLRFVGEKTIRHLHPLRTWTTLPGSVRNRSDHEVASCLTRFHLREIGTFLSSFRITREAIQTRAV